MARLRIACYFALGLGLLASAVGRPARGQADDAGGPPAPAGIRVRVTTLDGRIVEGTLARPTLRLDTAYGPLELAVGKVDIVAFAAEANAVAAIVELEDHGHLRGTLREPVVEVVTADGTVERLTPEALREIKVLRVVDTSIVALAIGLVTLSAMEIILGIDNIIFLAIIAGRLPPERQPQARRIGLAAALGTRIALLFSLTWLLGLTRPLFRLPFGGLDPDMAEISWRDVILFAGGAFLIGKSVLEMHHKLEEVRSRRETPDSSPEPQKGVTFAGTIAQIAVIDIVFSLDSVITAVGMVDVLWVMIVAMVIAMLVMLWFARPISEFVERHPTIKMLALSFLILIGVLLVAEALGQHISKGYIYFAMAFAVAMELVNMRLRPRPESKAESPADT